VGIRRRVGGHRRAVEFHLDHSRASSLHVRRVPLRRVVDEHHLGLVHRAQAAVPACDVAHDRRRLRGFPRWLARVRLVL